MIKMNLLLHSFDFLWRFLASNFHFFYYSNKRHRLIHLRVAVKDRMFLEKCGLICLFTVFLSLNL
jgi:hypothetical protein